MNAKEDEVEIYCPKCRGTEYERIHVPPTLAYPECWYYFCEFCNYTSEPD